MVKKMVSCSFCGDIIERGTGKIFVKKEEFDRLKQNINNWLITVRKDQAQSKNIPAMVKDLKEESQFQYELIMGLSGKIEELEEGVQALKLMKLIKMKNDKKK